MKTDELALTKTGKPGIRRYTRQSLLASDQVANLGKPSLRSDLSVVAVMVESLNDKSKLSHFVLFRPVPGHGFEAKAKLLDIKKVLGTTLNLPKDSQLRPGDTIQVLQSVVTKVLRFLPTISMSSYAGPQGPSEERNRNET
jgi:hypothetical protein